MKRTAGKIAAAILTIFYTSAGYTFEAQGNLCTEPDHYLSYIYNGISAPTTGLVQLYDEFGGTCTPIACTSTTCPSLGPISRLLNPATKFHHGKIFRPNHPNTHYTVFPVIPPVPTVVGAATFTLPSDLVSVQVWNQFGQFRLLPADFATVAVTPAGATPEYNLIAELLVPSIKKACQGGNCAQSCGDGDCCFPEGDHYLCYQLVPQDLECAAFARFEDQFQRNRFAECLQPTKLCNPVTKTYNGQTSVSNQVATNHLVCYSGNTSCISSKIVYLLNQLGSAEGYVQFNDEICVPSTKVLTLLPTKS